MATENEFDHVVEEIRQHYGNVIDLEQTPFVLIEILRNFGKLFDPDPDGGGGTGTGGTGTGGTGTGGVSPGTSTVAVGISPPPPPPTGYNEIEEILRVVLNLQKEVANIGIQLERLTASKIT